MNLRDIKKDIEYVLGAFVEDCSVFATINPKASDESIAALMEEAANLYNELKDRANEKPEGAKKAYYLGIRQDLLKKTDALYEKLSAAVKAAMEAPAVESKPAAKSVAAKKPAAKKAAAPKAEEKAEEKPAAEKKPAAKKAPATKKAAAEKKPAAKKPAAKKEA